MPRIPSYLSIVTYPNCYSYGDTRADEDGDYKVIARVYFRPLCISIYHNDPKYAKIISIARRDIRRILANIDKPIQISTTGETIQPYIKGIGPL
ncbi:hypothetical protein SAMN04488122_0911 [Chitinophaga arvensicola]|uniref:Uncharacterized protein n=1 Tax=Chitinophaga arvensicola TaxID=29529 RepID=A0A1I0PQI7_9BACT|nr:hypothetical protein SAMN04488122_0911 [Chitinophaga arvensicola]